MADANNKDTASDDFANDLDAMLNDTPSLDEADEVIDDEDAIDRLLMDDSETAEPDEFAEIDEFAEDSPTAIEKPITETNNADDEFDIDDLIDSSTNEANPEEDEFAEIDEFSENFSSSEPEQEANLIEDAIAGTKEDIPETTPDNSAETPAISDTDISMTAFDISDDDDDDDDDEFYETENTSDTNNNVAEQSIEAAILPISTPSPAINTEEIKRTNAAIDEINAQISQLWADNEELKQQLTELSNATKPDSTITEAVDTLQTEQRKLKKSLKENENRVPVVSYIALGLAILALLVGSGLGFIGYSAQSEVTELSEVVTSLEEEIEILIAKDSSKNIKKLNAKINALSKKEALARIQLEKINEALKTPSLKPIVDDLVVQNDHAQQAIETLLAKVDTLEKRKQPVAKVKKAKKIIPKVTWVVNLVSFKQEWYAKRKAAEFDKKGIPANVIKVKVNGEDWFRLTVKGFKSKYEAAAYAVKVKKTLNLDSTWVTKN